MCGIAGFVDPAGALPAPELEARALRMASAIAHRGPDDSGCWVDERVGVGLGHRRLSIIDLSPLGHQPMISASGRFILLFNGEIYNYRELRAELEAKGEVFRSQSDTEVLLAAVERWGFEASLKRFNAMFAMALWDRSERQLLLARDRFGEKPLYYGLMGGTLLFGSELKALRAHPDFRADVDRGALTQYLRFSCIPAPRTIHSGIWKLPAGAWTSFRPETRELRSPSAYWSMLDVAAAGERDPFRGSEDEAVEEVERLLSASVRARMVADVPLGAFLSGGIDSSTVVALMQAQSQTRVRTFTIGFAEATHDEAVSAKAVASHLGTAHTELYVTPEEARAVIPKLPTLYDEPFADSSQIPTFLVAQLARRDVTVALSGDGGDELFGGYNRYLWAERLSNRLAWLPKSARGALAATLDRADGGTVDRAAQRFSRWLPSPLRQRMAGDKVQKLAQVLRARDGDAVFARLLSTWADPESLTGVEEPHLALLGGGGPALSRLTERMMCVDAMLYLPDDILAKVDRATMGVSLESRVPILDPDVAAFAWRLPRHLKVRGSKGKWVIRRLLARHLPPHLFERPKMGFAVPVGDWLRGPLRPWAEAELEEGRIRRAGFLDPVPVRRAWHDHLEGRKNLQAELWAVLMFQAWHAEQGRRPETTARPRPAEGASVAAEIREH